jgi:hypothetical protein
MINNTAGRDITLFGRYEQLDFSFYMEPQYEMLVQ